MHARSRRPHRRARLPHPPGRTTQRKARRCRTASGTGCHRGRFPGEPVPRWPGSSRKRRNTSSRHDRRRRADRDPEPAEPRPVQVGEPQGAERTETGEAPPGDIAPQQPALPRSAQQRLGKRTDRRESEIERAIAACRIVPAPGRIAASVKASTERSGMNTVQHRTRGDAGGRGTARDHPFNPSMCGRSGRHARERRDHPRSGPSADRGPGPHPPRP